MEELCKRLRDLREDHDMTQTEIAKILNTTQAQIWKYESGQRELPIRHLITLCKLYGVSSDYVLGLPKNSKWPR